MNYSSDEPRYIPPPFAYPQGGPSSHAVNEQPNHHPATTNPNAEQSPYHAVDSGTSSNMNDYRQHQLTGSNHDDPNLGPYPSPVISGRWPSNDIHHPPGIPYHGGISQGVISDDSHHSSQTGLSNWGYPYQIDHERGEQSTSSSLPYTAQPPPNQHWPIESGMLDPASDGNLSSFSPTAVHSTQAQNTSWMYPHPTSQTYPAIGYSGPQTPIARDATTTTPYIEDMPPTSSNGSSALPGNNQSRFRTTNGPRPDPFASFPADDPSRALNYFRGSDYGQQTNDRLLGVQAPSNHSDPGSTHTHHSPTIVSGLFVPFPSPSNSASVSQLAQVEPVSRSDEDGAKENYFKICFPEDPKLQTAALKLSKEGWLRSDGPEPSLDSGGGQPLGAPASRFEPFFEASGSHRCFFFENGKRCPHTAPRKERALGHARGHFDYKPFYCNTQCGKASCTHKYHCQSALKDHIRRRGNPERACEICGRQISAQNIRRHRNTHPPNAQSEMPTSAPQDGPPKRSKLKRVVRSIGRAIKRSLSRSLSPPKQ